jgi:hypothetical protein
MVLMDMNNNIRRFFSLIGVNRAVFYAVLSKAWFAMGGAVTLLLITFYFSPELQGYYFTFYSLLSLQIFVELGMTVVIINFSSHEWSKLRINSEGKVVGDKDALSRLKSLVKVVFVWYRVGALLLLFGMGLAGYIFFSLSPNSGINWVPPWLALCFLTAVNLSLLPRFSLLEGCNQVAQVYFYRFIQEVVRALFIWAIIMLGGGLWSLPVSTLAVVIWAKIFLLKKYGSFFASLSSSAFGPRIDWWREVWPMQWRLAVSWLSGYFVYPLFTPALFHFRGAVAAGQMGMTLSMMMALTMISSMWIITKAPQFGIFVARREYGNLDKLLFRSTLSAVGIAMAGAVVIFSFVSFAYANDFMFAERFLPPLPTAFFLVTVVLMQISIGQSTYLRAHKREPFVIMGVITAGMTALAVLITAGSWGALGVILSYFTIILFFAIPYGTWVWWRFRARWQRPIEQGVPTLVVEGGA